mmetsp:Transcript_18141/g.39064  ORF Transcript_18141/g.39064 Transcript_18141/m.39064 type:complete len:95 (-) Transcript_18141:1087-1371(-)
MADMLAALPNYAMHNVNGSTASVSNVLSCCSVIAQMHPTCKSNKRANYCNQDPLSKHHVATDCPDETTTYAATALSCKRPDSTAALQHCTASSS